MSIQAELFSAPSAPKAGSQCWWVIRYIEANGSISDLEAYTKLGIRRLAARIYDLRDAGWSITTEDETHEGGTHARYRIAA